MTAKAPNTACKRMKYNWYIRFPGDFDLNEYTDDWHELVGKLYENEFEVDIIPGSGVWDVFAASNKKCAMTVFLLLHAPDAPCSVTDVS
jgi:hypothetical protein